MTGGDDFAPAALFFRQHCLRPTRPATICAWCNALLAPGAEPASHGICDPCAKIHFPEAKADER